MLSVKQVRDALCVDSVSKRNGLFTVRRGFFYTHGRNAEYLVNAVKRAFPGVQVRDFGEVWKPFRGGASVAAQSHWFVVFEDADSQVARA